MNMTETDIDRAIHTAHDKLFELGYAQEAWDLEQASLNIKTPLGVNPDPLPPGAPGAADDCLYKVPHEDWSGLMTDLLKSLTRAEGELRLLHTDFRHKHKAVGHLTVARHTLYQLEQWCSKEKE